MDPCIFSIFTGILICGTIIYLIALLIIAQSRYSIISNYSKKIILDFKENLGGLWTGNNGGGWIAGKYMFRTPLPISIKTKNAELNQLIGSHNKIIKLFWISAITLLPTVLVILNLIN